MIDELFCSCLAGYLSKGYRSRKLMQLMDLQVVESKIALQKKHVLVGNNDEITDLEWVGPIQKPSHICVATNSTHLRLFDMESMGCTATMAGHSDAVLCTAVCRMDDGKTLIVSGVRNGPVPNYYFISSLGICCSSS